MAWCEKLPLLIDYITPTPPHIFNEICSVQFAYNDRRHVVHLSISAHKNISPFYTCIYPRTEIFFPAHKKS